MSNVYFAAPSGPPPQGVFVLDPTTGLPSAVGGTGGGATETTLAALLAKTVAAPATAGNQITGGPQTGSGVVTATTQRVSLASDGPGVTQLQIIADRLPSTSLVLTPTVVVATGAGTAAAGARVMGFAVTGSAAATIAGASVPSGTSFDFTAPLNSTLAAVAYNATGTTLIVTRLA